MRVTVNITLTDPTSEEELAACGSSKERLQGIFTNIFTRILRDVCHADVTARLQVDVADNTKEGTST